MTNYPFSVPPKKISVDVGSSPLPITLSDTPSVDAFARLRTSNPETIFDSKQIFDNQPLFWDDQEVSGAGTASTYSVNKASTIMDVSPGTAGRRIRQTFQRFNYQPGKSQLILMTGTIGGGMGQGITRSMGMYDDDNGIFMLDDEGTMTAVIRTSSGGAPEDNKVIQADWNLDKLDGSGASGIILDSFRSQILIIDFEWLGVGRVRIGFVIDGIPVYVHEFLHSNVTEGVYMSTPNLPLRYEIENNGQGPNGTLEHICSSVISEGGSQALGVLRHTDTGAIISLGNSATYALLGIRLQSAKVGASVLLENLSQIGSTNDQFHWEFRLNPTVAGTFTYSDEPDSVVQTATGSASNTVTGGLELNGGYATTTIPVQTAVANALRLGAAIDGTVDEIVLVATSITNNITIRSSLTWRELS